MVSIDNQKKNIKVIVTRYHTLLLKRIKFNSACGSALNPAGELAALPQIP